MPIPTVEAQTSLPYPDLPRLEAVTVNGRELVALAAEDMPELEVFVELAVTNAEIADANAAALEELKTAAESLKEARAYQAELAEFYRAEWRKERFWRNVEKVTLIGALVIGVVASR